MTYSSSVPPGDNPFVIGGAGIEAKDPYAGLIDDVRIYSYLVDPVDIALLYTDFNPGSEVCIELPEYDVNEDCRIDVQDVAIFVEKWLECNLHPQLECY